MTKIEDAFEDLQIHHKDGQITNGPWDPLPFLSTFVLLHQKLPTIITKLAYFSTFIGGRPKGRGAPLCFFWWVPPMNKGKATCTQEVQIFFLRGGSGAFFWNLVFPFPMIPSCSHQVPNGFFLMFPMFPIATHFILYVLAKFLFLWTI